MYAIELELKLNHKERTSMARYSGYARFCYNYALALYQGVKDFAGGATSKKVAAIERVFTNHVNKLPEYQRTSSLSSRVYKMAFRHLSEALFYFFKGVGELFKFTGKKDGDSFTIGISPKDVRIQLENLNASRMIANYKLAAISDCGFYEFRRHLTYKSSMYGTKVELVERGYALSKTCSVSGHFQPMPLKERVFDRLHCGATINRNLNAAINLAHQ
ncbi:transposase [Kamptonema animale CS-326]|jgi:hypothetical protein|uniref:transposase n=1 Tax=Kamptonema animale TaxID=92934 RepID=UPI00232FB4E1|nr:transposase [Kamptonema animale]MDB9513748.1 transposase [Kamptonema animale CS-326]